MKTESYLLGITMILCWVLTGLIQDKNKTEIINQLHNNDSLIIRNQLLEDLQENYINHSDCVYLIDAVRKIKDNE